MCLTVTRNVQTISSSSVTRVIISVMYLQIYCNWQQYVIFCVMCMSVDKDAGIMASNIRCGVWSVEWCVMESGRGSQCSSPLQIFSVLCYCCWSWRQEQLISRRCCMSSCSAHYCMELSCSLLSAFCTTLCPQKNGPPFYFSNNSVKN